MSTYTKTVWSNGGTPAISAANLSNIETGIDNAHIELQAHLDDSVDAHDASAISNVAAGNIVATTVQAAINELDTEKLALAGGTMSGTLAMGTNQISGSNISFTGGTITGITDLAIADGGTGSSSVDTARAIFRVGMPIPIEYAISGSGMSNLSNAIDGSPTTYSGEGSYTGDGESIKTIGLQFDLGAIIKATILCSVGVRASGVNSGHLLIEQSDDNITYSAIYDSANLNCGSTEVPLTRIDVFAGRYLRLRVGGSTTSGIVTYLKVYEVQIVPLYPTIASNTTTFAPTYVKGSLYYDTTLSKLRYGGSAAWLSLFPDNVSATNKVLGRSTAGAGVVEEITCTAAGRALLDDADAATQRTTLGLGTIATQTASSVALTGGTITGTGVAPRIGTTASSATPTPNIDTTDHYTITALAEAATFGAPTGTPTDGGKLTIRIKDNATARALAWDGIYRAGTNITLPTTTVLSKTMYVGFIYNSADTKWDLVSSVGNI